MINCLCVGRHRLWPERLPAFLIHLKSLRLSLLDLLLSCSLPSLLPFTLKLAKWAEWISQIPMAAFLSTVLLLFTEGNHSLSLITLHRTIWAHTQGATLARLIVITGMFTWLKGKVKRWEKKEWALEASFGKGKKTTRNPGDEEDRSRKVHEINVL